MSAIAATSRQKSDVANGNTYYDLTTGMKLSEMNLAAMWETSPTSFQLQTLIYRRLIEAWMPCLPMPVDFAVASHIVRYTVGMGHKNEQGCGRPSAGFHYRQMATATGLSVSTTRRSVGRLREIGLINVNNGNDGQSLIIELHLNWKMPKDALPASSGRKALAAKRKPKTAPPASTWANPALGRTETLLLEGQGTLLLEEQSPLLSEEQHLESRDNRDRNTDTGDTSGYSATPASRSTEGPVPANENAHPIRRRQRPVVTCLKSAGKEDAYGGLPPTPNCARPPSATPDQVEEEPVTAKALVLTLERAAARQWPNAPMPWPKEQRLGVAHHLEARWPATRATPALAHRFAEWLIATWPDEEEDYPTAAALPWQRLLEGFADHLRQGERRAN